MRIASVGHAVFAATLLAMGILGLITGDFAPIWQPVPKGLPAREVLAYLSAFVSLALGTGLLWRRTAAPAARVLLVLLVLWLFVFKARFIVSAPMSAVSYETNGETAVLVAAACVVYAWLAAESDKGVRIGRAIYGLALIAFGVAHFAYLKLTASLVPAWLPMHEGWAYFTGATYVAAGAAVLIGVYARLAAALAALQVGLFTLLVWLPVVAASPNANQWSEFAVSWAITAGAWVLADSYRDVPWLARVSAFPRCAVD